MKFSTDEIKSMRIFSAMTFICVLCVWMILSISVNILFFTEKGSFFSPILFFTEKGSFFSPIGTRDAITLMDSILSEGKSSNAEYQPVIDDWKVLKASDGFNANIARFKDIDAMSSGIKIFIPFPLNVSIYQEYTAALKQIIAPIRNHLMADTNHKSMDEDFMNLHIWILWFTIFFFVLSIPKVLFARSALNRDPLCHQQKNLAYFTYRITRQSLISINAFLILGVSFFFLLTA